jgi:hypothetical protein
VTQKRALATIVAAGLAAGLAAGCSSGARAAGGSAAGSPPSTAAPATVAVPSTTPATVTVPSTAPPTTVYTPAGPQPSPDAAALALIQAWAAGSRATAARDASQPALKALFAVPYPGSWLQARGCTDASTNPGTCTYANRQSGSLYEIEVYQGRSGWYVTSVTVET